VTQIQLVTDLSSTLEYRSRVTPRFGIQRERSMGKGMDRKKEDKKKPAKSLQEKRAAKKEKKANKGFHV
jgi:hypothetical protein